MNSSSASEVSYSLDRSFSMEKNSLNARRKKAVLKSLSPCCKPNSLSFLFKVLEGSAGSLLWWQCTFQCLSCLVWWFSVSTPHMTNKEKHMHAHCRIWNWNVLPKTDTNQYFRQFEYSSFVFGVCKIDIWFRAFSMSYPVSVLLFQLRCLYQTKYVKLTRRNVEKWISVAFLVSSSFKMIEVYSNIVTFHAARYMK